MREDHRKNHQNRKNNRNHHNSRNKNGQRNQRNEEKEQSNKKVPMKYQIRSSKDTGSVEFKYEIDGMTERTKINIYEDGNDEEYLKMTKEFQNYLETFEIWENENAARIVYRNFRRCISGATKHLWDQINIMNEDEDRDELTFSSHVAKLTRAVLGVDAFDNQKSI